MLKIHDLTKIFHVQGTRVRALDGVDLEIAQGEFFVLLGPSGCGKTTMLRSIAGLERPDHGSIEIDGGTVFGGGRPVPPEHRPIAMVFQSYAVWPHMNVEENIAFPLREGVRKIPRREQRSRVREVLDLLALSELAARPVTTLSGGQQQRVALARALALQPKILLMDEPLSNLDFKLQVRLRAELKDLMHRLGLTTVYVTHNQAEAMETGDRIAVMDQGRIIQIGTPRDIYRNPVDEFVARFIGDMTLIPAGLAELKDNLAILDTDLGRLQALPPRTGRIRPGNRCFLGIRPEDVQLLKDNPAGENAVRGKITGQRFIGDAMLYTITAGDAVAIQAKFHHSVELAYNTEVFLRLPTRYCATVAPAAGNRKGFDPADSLMGGDGDDRY